MEREFNTLVKFERDLPKARKQEKYDIANIGTTSMQPIAAADFVVFVYENGTTEVLKNRYGREGVIVGRDQYNKLLELEKKGQKTSFFNKLFNRLR